MSSSLTRRTALKGAAAAVAVSTISPAVAKALRGSADVNDIDTQLNILFEQFDRDARIIDPSITGAIIMRDLTVPGRDPRGAVACISFSRGEHGLIRRVSGPEESAV